MKINPLVLIPPAVFVAIAGFFAIGMMRGDDAGLPSTLVGQELPPTNITALADLPPLTDAALRDGQVKVVNFWASWCAPCRLEHPNLMELSETGLPVYGVNYRDNPDDAVKFLAELGNPFTAIGTDPQARLGLEWGVYGVPETFLVGADGKIIQRIAGPLVGGLYDNRFRPALDAALNN
ncbi:DsbE family thiol:disulfide interchange protein [Ketogulonicigenium vulgare]|uniref:Periplasmic protein thiol:disulfide oxidoreductase, DsbE subfamily protein n=1 Tax=Ketogulonicigenium vulgare (strain WSH-001) TaxID=759362 RepID=F9Y5F4_KETVW|nr:DsbE family thiol:disulfide interchange protein [Ketogulonicigenium vulgare]ADO42510.1 Probable thiol-disulfide interchange protein [Ketogulonicigenium vulgare Y25]AEM40707.1 Periplasmic protein thiol:disulfide oxidoreductase, DsbE subfamily protein [Ketogulonicigenium vulgare WSH-001]ALJ80877.1 thiol:disulfide interchange protein [Ketogulonicigenium vulgare]ANW33651.1 thiol:disulfide interchange protein [Ketogulonicigenium vulgare]AOZ54423.1 thiol-disulfide interchange protein [Ketogulonic